MLPFVELIVHQVMMLPLVERDCHQWMLPLVEINGDQGVPIVDSGDQSLPLVDSGYQGPMHPSEHVCLSLVERDGWIVLNVWLTYQCD